MFQVSWLVHGELFCVNTPNLATAEFLAAILPRWMRPRMWHNPRQRDLVLFNNRSN